MSSMSAGSRFLYIGKTKYNVKQKKTTDIDATKFAFSIYEFEELMLVCLQECRF